ncbi:hypothetical protein GCM10007972_05710 [Iodidimonas muriae]|uniref:DUF4282 domain-containing protein n=1 Tax=Iodidimonas muriae TaxID=261467 RepID=A0ABQ2L8T8_9PROT|nr:DUF6768 family protein [Iodidimonas muriae]GER05799.1 hypothetical protein JCM17843_01090 [Kordiimonadales bacterium JCM 17843]GGO06933.1 hypothetical protein GCM10007972_05710 [Iodidimonas muriae]
MTKLDDLIEDALTHENQTLSGHSVEPGYFAQAKGLFHGPLGWVMWLVYIVQVLAFAAAAFSFWQMLIVLESVMAVRWGIGAVLLFLFTLSGKSFMGSHLEANRILREVKRLELRLSMMEAAKANDSVGEPK